MKHMDYKLTEDGLYAYQYPRASVTADAVLFAEKQSQLYVLLIQRGNDPYKGYWAFPGGFLNMDETVARCAERELEEETGIVLPAYRHNCPILTFESDIMNNRTKYPNTTQAGNQPKC